MAQALPQHISPTAAKSYLSCSLRFWFERVACIRKPTNPALHLGKAVHAAPIAGTRLFELQCVMATPEDARIVAEATTRWPACKKVTLASGATFAGPYAALRDLVDRGAPVKVSFFGSLRLGRVGEVSCCSDNGVRVASLLDLAAQKVRVVQVRAERKDYLDLATLLECGVSLPMALGAAHALYPDFSPLITLKALSYFEDGDLHTLPEAIRQRLASAAAIVTVPAPVPLKSARLDA